MADFTSIVAGTIDGRVDFAISTGAMDINLDNVRLTLGQSTGPSSQLLTNPQPTITSVQIIPEPAVAAPAAAALLLGLRRRARAR